VSTEEIPVTRQELAAISAGFNSLFALLVRQLNFQGTIDIADLLSDLDRLISLPGKHELTTCVHEEARESLLGVLVRGPERDPETWLQSELPNVAPIRQSIGFEPRDKDRGGDA
jgi:hypothetical protein